MRPGLVLCCLLIPGLAHGQGLLLESREGPRYRLPRPIVRPQPPHEPRHSYRIDELAVQVRIQDQVARSQVTQTFVNTGSRTMEVCFLFPLPYDGAVDRMTFMIDGKEFPARLLSATEARQLYEGYVRRNQDPALMEWVGTGLFKTSVFPVPAGAQRTVTLSYSQICRKHLGLTEFLFPLSTAKYTEQPVRQLRLEVFIESAADIKNIYSPTHALRIERPAARQAKVEYTGQNEVPATDFRLMYDVGDQRLAASLLSYRPNPREDGYFLLLVSPEIKRAVAAHPVPKSIVFVVDRSGSMSGPKIEQAKGALRFVLNNLNEGDLFNIVAYDTDVESFRPELQRFDDKTRTAAVGFVEGLYAGGSTNIDSALQLALSQFQDPARPNYVVFLTDGLPTAGERTEARIVENARQRNTSRARVFSFGVGYDVNSRLLDKISRACFGESEFVRPDEDIEAGVSRLYNRIGAPVLTDVAIDFDMEGFAGPDRSLVNRVYPKEHYDLFAGDQLVLVGRYRRGGSARLTLTGRVGTSQETFTFPGPFVARSADDTHGYIEKLWAIRRVGEIIDEIDLQGKNAELVDELVQLATKHGILTPYTSFLADETTDHRDLARVRRQADTALERLAESGGRSGFVQRDLKSTLQRARYALAPGSGGASSYRRLDDDQEVVVHHVKQVGGKTFLLRSGRWIDSTLRRDQEQQAIPVERYGDEYFELARRHGKQVAQYLAMEGEVTFIVNGQAYTLQATVQK